MTDFHKQQEALKEYLASEQADKYNSRSANIYKYNNLKFGMEPTKITSPHLIIVIGISESVYNLETGERLSGGLGSDEKYIRKWLDKAFIKSELLSLWEKTKKTKHTISKVDLEK